jgi:glutaredoxin
MRCSGIRAWLEPEAASGVDSGMVIRPLFAAALMLVAFTHQAQAQYKIVAPDGRVTYTDRPPADASAKVIELGRRGTAPPAASTGVALPGELARLAERFPVTLFTAEKCAPCDAGRQFLQQRGIPYTERLVVSNDDVAALERTVSGRTVPALTVGGQALRGYSQSDWTSYLDAAGYPRESRLPRGWAAPAPAPLVARAPVPPPTASAPAIPAPAPPVPSGPETGPDGATGIRF